MPNALPSLNALRAFEAFARLGSLSRAAAELHVTPAAISHQLKTLEAQLEIRLVWRDQGRYQLSEGAQAVLPMLGAGFEHIAEAVRRLRTDAVRKLLTISVNPSFAATWLVRRLNKFDESFPDIDVRLLITNDLANFTSDGVDMAIRFGKGRYPGLSTIRLFAETFYPVCSPALLEARGIPSAPPQLLAFPLLHVDWSLLGTGDALDWPTWLQAAGVVLPGPLPGSRFRYTSYALQAALDGKGVALASDAIAGDELRSGRLRRLFGVAIGSELGYYLAYPAAVATVRKITLFQDWLLSEINAGPALTAQA